MSIFIKAAEIALLFIIGHKVVGFANTLITDKPLEIHLSRQHWALYYEALNKCHQATQTRGFFTDTQMH
jgi:hypothetical protein